MASTPRSLNIVHAAVPGGGGQLVLYTVPANHTLILKSVLWSTEVSPAPKPALLYNNGPPASLNIRVSRPTLVQFTPVFESYHLVLEPGFVLFAVSDVAGSVVSVAGSLLSGIA